jgi:hypothetical protein
LYVASGFSRTVQAGLFKNVHVTYRYREDVLAELPKYGVQPTPETRPDLVHEFVSDLYRFELRRLRDRLMRQEFPKKEYYGRVVELRRKYRVISLRPGEWVAE